MMAKVRWINLVRIVGLSLVLIYHFFKDILPGGFFGVDVFFTFSGYLITSLVIKEFQKNKTFAFLPYLKRRTMRIFPPLLFSVIFTLPFVKLLPSDFTAGLDKQLASAIGFITNYFEIFKGGSYEAQLLPHLYIHTWSLALEMHYYLLWGLFCYAAVKVLKVIIKQKEHKVNAFKITVIFMSLMLGLSSYLHMQSLFNQYSNISVAYFATTSHIYPFFIGSIFGVLFGLEVPDKVSQTLIKKRKFFTIVSIILFLISLISLVILSASTNFEEVFSYRYGFILASFLTSIMIVSCRSLHETVPKYINEYHIISHLADLSYPIYLFHWPLFIVFSNVIQNKILSVLLTFALSYVFSLLEFYFIEPMFYRKNNINLKQNESFVNIKIFNKNITKPVTIFISAVFVLISFKVFAERKDISDLEKEQMVANVVQEVDNFEALKSGVDNLNPEPVVQREGISGFDNLENSLQQKQVVQREGISRFDNLKNSLRQKRTVQSKTSSDFEKNVPISRSQVNVNVTMVGDSVALGARKKLLETIPNAFIDTKGSRSLHDGYNLITEWQKSNSLGEYVVVALGTNGCEDWETYINKIINELEPGHRLIFVTPFDGHWTETWRSYKTMQYLRSIKDKYKYVTIADWYEEISKQPELLGSDKTHIGGNSKAIQMFVDVVENGIKLAGAKEVK